MMKKIFTLFVLLACFMGAKAVEVVDAEVDFSKYSDISEFKFAGWGASESAVARLTIQDGCLHFHSEEATDPSWDCQFHPIGGVSAEIGVVYTLHYKIKGSVAQNVSMLGFGQTPYGQFPITTDWVEGTVDYECTDASGGNILMQCGDYVGDWDIAYLKITHEESGNQKPVEWIELLTNGDAEKSWADLGLADVVYNDSERNTFVCAWGKVKGKNLNEDGAWNPYPADIEEVDGSHVFVVHAAIADTEGDASAWDNQFWIQSPKQLKVGSQYKIHFRYKASQDVVTNTQFHHQTPSDYVHWQAIGDVSFTTAWQDFDQTFTVPDAATDAYSIAFNLNPNVKDAVDFYIDDISLSEMKLDHGFFVASSNTTTGIEYDFDNAIEFVDGGDGLLVATVGTQGKQDSWVNELMISTVRGHNASFKGGTIKPSTTNIKSGEDEWYDYTEGSNAKIKLPAAGVWKISIDTEYKSINFVQLEGEEIIDKPVIQIDPNPTEVVVKGQERDDLADGSDGTINEEEGGEGQPWDNQFFIIANRTLSAGEVTVISFRYKSSIPATSGTQCHGEPGAYLHWNCLGTFNFTEEWQNFETTFTVPSEADGMKSIAFNMAEIKAACDYYITDVIWRDEASTESLIDQTGTKNFYVKEGAGTSPYEFGTDTGINNVNDNTVRSNDAIYNLAGQRVSKNYKGVVIKNGSKYIVR
ncbi:MAG: carbohydrate binding domain-containing protein [Prevotella sp.]|nr:carbohydrate binding domain-containing protein [Prevotella sp.]